jgi:hypothetical protein
MRRRVVVQQGGGVAEFGQAQVQDQVGGLEPYVGFEAGGAAEGRGPVPAGSALSVRRRWTSVVAISASASSSRARAQVPLVAGESADGNPGPP